MSNLRINHLEELESEAIYIIREVYSNFQNPAILFSGGKDSILVTHLAKKAFFPSKIPFPIVHIDTGHNFDETIKFRDDLKEEMDLKLIVGSVEEMILKGIAHEEKGINATRNIAQIPTLLHTIEQHKFDALIGGARRDEEKARAKERFFSHRDEFGQWDPKNQRPELWHIYNTKVNENEHFRVFPISNWTELDVWQYFLKEDIKLPSLYFAHNRDTFYRNGVLLSQNNFLPSRENEEVVNRKIRFRTMGDITITGAYPSNANTIEEIIIELSKTNTTERGTRADDKRSDSAMEDRKKEGYF